MELKMKVSLREVKKICELTNEDYCEKIEIIIDHDDCWQRLEQFSTRA